MNPLIVDELREARAALSRPAHLAEGIPGHFYGPSFYALEQQTLFPRSWCAVSVASALPNPGDVVPIDLAGWPIILVRGRDRQIRAFHNICRHRAMRPVAEACNVNLIRCPWHSWSYDLQGNLLAMPEIGGAGVNAAEGFDKSALGLKQIRVGIWLDYVFVNLDGTAPPFAEHIKPAVDLLADLDLEGLRHGARSDDVYEGNWKLSTEGGIEDYHLISAHPQLNAQVARNTTPCFVPGVYTGGWIDLGLNWGKPSVPSPSARALPPIRTRDGLPLAKMLVFNVFPTGTVLIQPDHVMVGVLLPDGASSTKVELHYYYQNEAATSPEFRDAREESLNVWRQVIPQDFPFVIGTQATLATRDAAGIRTRFSPYWEQPLIHFQRMVIDAVEDPRERSATAT